ncbi:MATE family efflux transporter [Plectonema cf. radiosum LEGE 06105]|uniref:MATE family efflux transporter n=1 Tax=Plectonema cf. radiosum LEGE 06105 TaxID=945769 RepID=A0A8J7K182_9CYAN|nr:MATE family efflux transporter [Plectonema radiosum]MBE9213157.1 MATE family efflux transporter [Plectonema cf. radiosum LEGE 06105]
MSTAQQSQLTNEILNGNLVTIMFKLSIPGIIGMLLVGLNSFLDALFAGQLIGQNALAGISLALPLTSIVTGCAVSIGVGSASVMSRAIGSGDIETESQIIGNLTVISIIISFFIAVIGYIFGNELIAFMGGDGEVAKYGVGYLKTYIIGSIFFIPAVASNTLVKSEAKIRLATVFSFIFVTTNFFLNIIFVKFLNFGIQGIALATNLAALAHFIVNFAYFIFYSRSSITSNSRKINFGLDLVSPILSVGASVMLMQLTGIIQQIIIFKSIADYGTDSDIAFAGATVRLYFLVITPLNGLVQALQPVIGISYGARNYRRLKKAYFIFCLTGTILFILIWLTLQVSPTFFLRWVIPNLDITTNNSFNFRLITFTLITAPFLSCSLTLFQSIGNAKIAAGFIIFKQIVLFIPLLLLLTMMIGVNGVYYSFTITEILSSLIIGSFTLIEFIKIEKVIKKV